MFPSVLLSLFVRLDRGLLNCTGGSGRRALAPRWSETAGRRTQSRLQEREVMVSDIQYIHGIIILFTGHDYAVLKRFVD